MYMYRIRQLTQLLQGRDTSLLPASSSTCSRQLPEILLSPNRSSGCHRGGGVGGPTYIFVPHGERPHLGPHFRPPIAPFLNSILQVLHLAEIGCNFFFILSALKVRMFYTLHMSTVIGTVYTYSVHLMSIM